MPVTTASIYYDSSLGVIEDRTVETFRTTSCELLRSTRQDIIPLWTFVSDTVMAFLSETDILQK
jgi:hypothetical protein